MGVGLVLVVGESDRDQVMTALVDAGERGARVIGEVVRGSHPRVRYVAGGV
jgi:phosphoribosylaminoimidazole (AIR) synthetase